MIDRLKIEIDWRYLILFEYAPYFDIFLSLVFFS